MKKSVLFFPAVFVLLLLHGCSMMNIVKGAKPQTGGVIIEHFFYPSEGLMIKAFSARPEQEGIFPLVVINHGFAVGPIEWNFFHPERSPFIAHAADLCRDGYVVFFSQYRGFGESEGRQTFGPGEARDVMTGIDLMRNKRYVDRHRIALVGGSEGAMISLLVAAERNDIAAVVEVSGPVDMEKLVTDQPWIIRQGAKALGIGKTKEADLTQYYRARSPWLMADKIGCPVLIIHGDNDSLVPVEHAYIMAEALREADVPYELRILPAAGHGLFGAYQQQGPSEQTWTLIKSFLNYHLKN